jgi:Ala-tRNA(Pro) deacylase
LKNAQNFNLTVPYFDQHLPDCRVLEESGKIVGFCVARGALVDLMMIDCERHREGFGRTLLVNVETDFFRAHPVLRLESFADNHLANAFYAVRLPEGQLSRAGMVKIEFGEETASALRRQSCGGVMSQHSHDCRSGGPGVGFPSQSYGGCERAGSNRRHFALHWQGVAAVYPHGEFRPVSEGRSVSNDAPGARERRRAMAIAMTVQQYLAVCEVEYEVVAHPLTQSSMESAQASNITGDRIAKAVVLRAEDGYLLAVLPASHHIRFGQLTEWLDEDVGLATEEQITTLFADCEIGAVPAVGDAYGLEVILDDSVTEQPDVYFEGGDHATLVHLTAGNFRKLVGDVQHTQFSVHN